ncbi:MAG: SH3 domain-containing protein [Lachnospiraceae bacterium]|nr:SH3 domain-containing protein [Lachnospiraceae bacterium]
MKSDYPERLASGYYKVKYSWEGTQVGQYRKLSSAIAKCDETPETYVYDPEGTAIYPEAGAPSGETEAEVMEPRAGVGNDAETDGNAAESADVFQSSTDTSPDTTEAFSDAPTAAAGASEEDGQTNTKAQTENAAEAKSRISADYETEDAVANNTADTPAAAPAVGASTESDDPELTEEEIASAKTEAIGVYPNNGNTEPIAYGLINTLLNIREGNSLDAAILATVRKNTIVEILEECGNGWYRIKFDASDTGYAYVWNKTGSYLNIGKSLYTVAAGDSIWKIAEKTLGDGKRFTDIKTLNRLASNVIRVGMELLIP